MSQQPPSRTLMGYLAMPIIGQLVEKKLFGGPVIRFTNFLQLCHYLYECGALLGRARRDCLETLVQLLPVIPGKEHEVIEFLQEFAGKRLSSFRELNAGEEPPSFFNLFYTTELATLDLNLWDPTNVKGLNKALNEKWSLQKAEPLTKAFGNEGVGFGSAFPDLTEKMYRQSRQVSQDDWNKTRQLGFNLPDSPTVIGLEEQEEIVLSMVACYATEHFPHLLAPLRLNEYVPQE